jgi:4a-hydroxytetrahydrobiopterin dehydratase
MKPLETAEVHRRLVALPRWRYEDNALRRDLEFRDFASAFAFMVRVAALAEAQNHHPDWRNVYRHISVALSTHDAGGVTERDFALAAAMDSVTECEREQ